MKQKKLIRILAIATVASLAFSMAACSNAEEATATQSHVENAADVVEESDIDTSNTNTASVFAQEGAELTLNDFVSKDYTSSVGPRDHQLR